MEKDTGYMTMGFWEGLTFLTRGKRLPSLLTVVSGTDAISATRNLKQTLVSGRKKWKGTETGDGRSLHTSIVRVGRSWNSGNMRLTAAPRKLQRGLSGISTNYF
jgi:hypothetical protein